MGFSKKLCRWFPAAARPPANTTPPDPQLRVLVSLPHASSFAPASAMIAILGDVHDLLGELWDTVEALPSRVDAVIQLGDLWVWPEPDDVPPGPDGQPRDIPHRPRDPRFHWRRLSRELLFIDGNHHPYWLTRGLAAPTRVAPGLRYLPRGTVLTLPGLRGPLRIGVLGGAESVLDARWRRLGDDWWPEEEAISAADVERLLANAAVVGGLDLLLTHIPPASVTEVMTRGDTPHPSATLVEEAWRALGGGVADPPLELIASHMHASWRSERLRVEVLALLGVTIR